MKFYVGLKPIATFVLIFVMFVNPFESNRTCGGVTEVHGAAEEYRTVVITFEFSDPSGM